MRVLFLLNAGHIGGGNRSLLSLWNGLRGEGITPIAVCPTDGPMVDACREAGVPCVVREFLQPERRSPMRTYRASGRWVKFLRQERIDIVHANSPESGRIIAISAWWLKIPTIHHFRFPVGSGEATWCFRGLPRPRIAIFNSRALQAECGPDVQRLCPRTRQVIVHNGVDLRRFSPTNSTPHLPPRVGIVANLMPVKGHEDFLGMAGQLHQRGVSAEYWIVGGDVNNLDRRETLVQLANELGIDQHVRFLGFREDVAEVMNQLDVVVLPSHVEPFGRCLIEAMACEKPVVATQVGGIPEVVEDGCTGVLVPVQSPIALADAVERLLSDADLARRMGLAGRLRATSLFSEESHARQIATLYREVSGMTPIASGFAVPSPL